MDYNFRKTEKYWQQRWRDTNAYEVSNDSLRPKYYVLDMFPYPSGAGLHVGHPLGYIASDIYARYKRLKGFNVLHPMGYDSFGLPAEQYALETGQHPAVTTENNINTFRKQLDNIGFSFDWSRELKTSDPKYYKWTQWIFLQLFNSYFCHTEKKALPISKLINKYATKGSRHFTAEQWNAYSEKEQQDILMRRRLAFLAYGEVNWCEALGTVLANDEVINGVSERGGHPVVKKKMHQWYLRITDYAERLLQGLETVEFTDAMKEMQRNWIGKSEGVEITFSLTPTLSTCGEGEKKGAALVLKYSLSGILQFENAKRMRKEYTEAENILWQQLRKDQLGVKFRRQHPIDSYIVDFISLQQKLIIEIDGGYHETQDQKELDKERTKTLNDIGFEVLRFTNNEVSNSLSAVLQKIKNHLQQHGTAPEGGVPLSLRGEGPGVRVYTTRPDTIFGVDFMVLAPEHELVQQITTPQQKEEIEKYLEYVKSRSERERLAEVKSISGAFTGAYAINPFDGREIPIWISEYVLAGYGTGAIMAVPCGDQRDFSFAKHFGIPITNIIGEHYNGEEANATKEATLTNSDFLNGILMKDAIGVVIDKLEELGIGKRKINYKMRDAGFSRQRYWGEPFPIIYKNGIAYPVDEKELPITLPHVENYKPGPEGEGPLANITEWVNPDLIPGPSPKERGEDKDNTFNYVTSDADTWKTLKPFARENRKNKTDAENLLWQNLRNRNISDCKFRRQHAIGGFIADLVCIEKKLVIEIDGKYHNDEEQKKYDNARTKYLQEQGFKEVRFKNEEVLKNISNVLEKIRKELAESPPLLWRGVRGEVKRETNTMPGYAGSSWYFLRYADPHNENEFADKKATDYWNQVDVYVGGTEHAVGHLLYSRMWTKVLFDLGLISFDEPFRKLVNQGMIQGVSEIAYRFHSHENLNENLKSSGEIKSNMFPYPVHQKNGNITMLSMGSKTYSYYFSSDFVTEQQKNDMSLIHIPIKFVENNILNINNLLKEWKDENIIFATSTGFFFEGKWYNTDWEEIMPGAFRTISAPEKMSKRYQNVVNPDEVINKYGADTFRMYEMFLGPVEASKPWDTKGIEGVHRFLKKLWRLFYDDVKGKIWNDEKATDAELKVLHKTIKKIEEDTERFSYNTAVSAFMVCVNELHDLKSHKKEILEKLLVLLTPYAPHVSEELWYHLQVSPTGGDLEGASILDASFPTFDPKYLIESSKEYPISINGKMRTTINISLDATEDDIRKIVLENDVMKKWIDDKPIKKLIYVKNKMVNVVV